ncbi:thioredoxin family protein [Niastella populi]|uniref:Thioredoxin domain-containing protein n=1 Tax=Niastella populi TaxID=550983 RepID=A0A1V9ERZ4_9BACT|nr:thioredoxin family protein [Niastella populi]OQP48919.1 hypothetical protein A4R26_31240 [Niastella populi]
MKNFESYIQGPLPVVVEFYADWSDACNRMQPVMEEVKEIAGSRAVTLRIDIDKNENIARQYGIYTVPDIAIFKDGSMIWHQNGIVAAHTILDRLMLEMQ